MKFVALVAERVGALYGDELSLRRLLAMAGVCSGRVPFDGRASNVAWFATVEAVRQGRLLSLVGVMLEEYPLDEMVVGVYMALEGGENGEAGEAEGEG